MNTNLGTVIIRCLDRLFFTHWRDGGVGVVVVGVGDVGVGDVGVGDVGVIFCDIRTDGTSGHGSEVPQTLLCDHLPVWLLSLVHLE
jgi:hypothetical protein